MERFDALHAAADGGDAGLYFETTAGAGLPIVSTIRAFADSGDTIRSIEGVFSGTVAFLMSELRSGRGFSEAVQAAHVAGYTEPDPREDLSGADVARKLLILARVAGYRIEPDEVDVTPLLSNTALNALSVDDFWEALPTVDKGFADLDRDATKRGGVLCYLARFAEGRASVGLDVVDPSHPCAALHGTDNVFLVRSERYAETPLVIRGPGAGPDVTAAGVLADILTAVRETWPR
jgi:bifunctional aspartokinase / homoserine dehydrogenase 1